jgi:hypothetical protein
MAPAGSELDRFPDVMKYLVIPQGDCDGASPARLLAEQRDYASVAASTFSKPHGGLAVREWVLFSANHSAHACGAHYVGRI